MRLWARIAAGLSLDVGGAINRRPVAQCLPVPPGLRAFRKLCIRLPLGESNELSMGKPKYPVPLKSRATANRLADPILPTGFVQIGVTRWYSVHLGVSLRLANNSYAGGATKFPVSIALKWASPHRTARQRIDLICPISQ